ncbi:hypothetical protein GUITHDRAFT_115779 [Guillardia theta CCMP2712]|uniref:Uncharacterized protein n=1 Tax=Guillardia theta (strain CCMP2712) TaxID=905079 RepID=L1IP00_GUITC|nr:hypothetical protein GUITHDRAFT_115779 [Guillardia theta CCMP2712]EKX38016.1 hypothetical protein GUITHDRAFT_115779 [Guillardia theta CCMP2712]|eukprot:XP_005824996.1 hypothetical protein GUITHDRAFT_115779 [Guillardia theta CCMP2712]
MTRLMFSNEQAVPAVRQQRRQIRQSLAWSGFTYQMQEEADKALRLCKVGLMGPGQHCATHVIPTDLTMWTHSDAGQPEWEESQRVLDVQGPEIGTPGDFGDR